MAAPAGTPIAMSFAQSTPDNASTPPIERSKPPTSNTIVSPMAATRRTAFVLRMLMKLSYVANVGSVAASQSVKTTSTLPTPM